MHIIHLNRDPKPDPVKQLRKILREKWDARDEAQAKKDIPKLVEALRKKEQDEAAKAHMKV